MKSILIDSDVCLDVYLFRMPFYTASSKLLTLVEQNKFEGTVSAVAFANIFYLMRKNAGINKATVDLKILRDLTKVGTINSGILDKALYSNWRDFEDAMQHFCAIEEGCAAIITRNTSDFKKSSLPVYTPAQFLGAEGLA